MSVAEKLDQLERLTLEFQASMRNEPRRTAAGAMDMREQFNDICTELVKAMANEPRIAFNRPVFEAMQNAIEALRSRMLAHQLKWEKNRIDDDPVGYFNAVQPIHDVLRDFIANARVFVRD